MKTYLFILTISLSVLFISSCNVVELAGIAETSLDPDTFRSGKYRVGSICSGPSNASSYPFHEGDGTSGNPYVICNIEEFQEINNYLASHFKLDADIDASGFSFTPIGSSTSTTCAGTSFTGTLKGEGYSVYDLNTSESDTVIYSSGVFSNIGMSVRIENISFINTSINASSSSGDVTSVGLIGCVGYNGTYGSSPIENIYFSGSINVNSSGKVEQVGSIVGYDGAQAALNKVESVGKVNVYAASSSTGNRRIGGVLGFSVGPMYQIASRAEINISASSGSIADLANVGGITGEHIDYGGPRSDGAYYDGTINVSDVTSVTEIGGAFGHLSMGTDNIYSSPSINFNSVSTIDNIGGISGQLQSGVTITASFSDFDSTGYGATTNGGLVANLTGGTSMGTDLVSFNSACGGTNSYTGCTTLTPSGFQGSSASTTLGNSPYFWDFSTVWKVTNGYPRFIFE